MEKSFYSAEGTGTELKDFIGSSKLGNLKLFWSTRKTHCSHRLKSFHFPVSGNRHRRYIITTFFSRNHFIRSSDAWRN